MRLKNLLIKLKDKIQIIIENKYFVINIYNNNF